MKKCFSYCILISIIVYSCKKDNYETIARATGKSYFNIKENAKSIFKVEEIIYNDFFNTIDTQRYFLKEINDTVFNDNIGRKSMRIYRYKSIKDTMHWQFLNAWYSTVDNFTAERVEDNKRLVKLSFPLSEDAVWNYNAFNTENGINLFYDFIHQKYVINTYTFDSAIAVKSETINNLARERQYQEVYANHIGLVYKNQIFLDKNGNIKRGYKIKQSLIKHDP